MLVVCVRYVFFIGIFKKALYFFHDSCYNKKNFGRGVFVRMAMQGEKKTRLLLSVAIILVVIIFSLVFFQFPDNTHAEFTFSAPDDNGCVKVTGYTGNPSTLNIPATDKDGHKVVAIAESAFSGTAGYDRIKKVKVPNTVLVIEEDAFAGAPNLEVVELSSNLVTIGDNAFADCRQLDTIEFPETLEVIGAKAFFRCSNLGRLYVPASVKDIGEQAFLSCENLMLDVSDNVYAADVAAAERIETGTIDTTMIYVIVILSITVVATVLIVFAWHHIRRRLEKKNKAE